MTTPISHQISTGTFTRDPRVQSPSEDAFRADPVCADRPQERERFARGLLAAAIFTLGLAACGEAVDDTTGTVPADPTITETAPLDNTAPPAEPITPVQ